MTTIEPHHIIAIGASAGGIEEINAFFDNTPVDGVYYIIISICHLILKADSYLAGR